MKKLFGYIFMTTVLFTGILIPVQNIDAADGPGKCGVSYKSPVKTVINDVQSKAECDAFKANDPNVKAVEYISNADREANGGILSGIAKDVANGLLDALMFIPAYLSLLVLKLVQWLTHLSGMILNYVVFYTVVDMKETLGNAGVVEKAWQTIRDIGNMGFIFVLLYAAIMTILGLGQDNQKLIVKVVVVAILINFSLFFTKVIIDISNLLATMFYEAIAPGALSSNITQGLSNSLMEPLKLQSIFDSLGSALDTSNLYIIGIGGSIFSLVAAFVFFAISILLIIRFVVLIFVLVLSPLAFLSMVLPSMSEHGKKWWAALSSQAFFAPIYFALTWVVIVIAREILNSDTSFAGFAGTPGANGSVTAPPRSAIAMMVNFTIVISMLVISMVLAKNWAAKTPGGVGNLTKWAMGAAGGATLGVAGRLGRNTLGMGSEAFQNSAAYRRLQTNAPTSRLARLAIAAAEKTGRGSFDMRGAPVIGGVMSGMLDAGGPDGVGGYEAREERREKVRKSRAEAARKAQDELDIAAGVGPAAIPAATRTPAQQTAVNNMEKAISSASDKEIEAIVESNKGLLNSQEFANNISVKQLEAINKSDKFTEAEKDQFKGHRFAAINNPAGLAALAVPAAARTPAQQAAANTIGGAIRGLSDSELEMMDAAHLSRPEFVSSMRPAQLEAIGKSNKFTTSQKGAARNSRRQPLMNAVAARSTATADVDAAKSAMKSLGHKEIAALDITVLTNPTMLHAYTPQLLKRMVAELNPADIVPIRDEIIRVGAPSSAWLGTPDGQIFS